MQKKRPPISVLRSSVRSHATHAISSDRKKLLKFEAEGGEFGKKIRSLEQFIQTVKGENNLWYQNIFLTCSWRQSMEL